MFPLLSSACFLAEADWDSLWDFALERVSRVLYFLGAVVALEPDTCYSEDRKSLVAACAVCGVVPLFLFRARRICCWAFDRSPDVFLGSGADFCRVGNTHPRILGHWGLGDCSQWLLLHWGLLSRRQSRPPADSLSLRRLAHWGMLLLYCAYARLLDRGWSALMSLAVSGWTSGVPENKYYF